MQYDPYAPGSDFVRGYPFSMREGKRTAVSHGGWGLLWLWRVTVRVEV